MATAASQQGGASPVRWPLPIAFPWNPAHPGRRPSRPLPCLAALALLTVLPAAAARMVEPGPAVVPFPAAVAIPGAVPFSGGPAAAGAVYPITLERRALLNTIRYAEGTWVDGSGEGYRMLYGGGRFHDLARHPEITVVRRYRSAAAGAYQFLPGTWQEAARRLGLRDFQPASQDQAALYLVEKRGALQQFDRNGLAAEVLARLAPEWASLPTLAGVSQYGQPVKGLAELQRFYSEQLLRQRTSQTI